MPSSMKSRGSHSRVRVKVKVKSGCRTCKIRKVKCDESRPACDRCISTGRVCDGYGIWGGGGNFYGRRQRHTLIDSKEIIVVSGLPVSVSALTSDTKEMWYFEWFKCRTAVKLPGSFVSNFWTTLLFQASSNEPAVLHAILALSSVQNREITSTDGQSNRDKIPDLQEQFTLQHYVKAISHLQPHFSTKTEASFRVALITCIVFVYLEFLRGHFKTAQIYLQNGLKILRDLRVLSDRNNGIFNVEPYLKSTDRWIVEAFSRLHLQVELFKHAHHHPCLVLHTLEPKTPIIMFRTINEAWQQLERLLNKVFHLTYQGREEAVSACEFLRDPSPLLENQQHVLKELAQWLDMYEAFTKAMQRQWSADEEKAYQLLYLYHTMATIMADTCLRPSDEVAYDSHTNQFVLLIRQSANLRTVNDPHSPIQALPGHLMDMSRSIVDMGWIPPLYYAAVKCRVHRIRLQAIRLLESTSHREGIWDAKTAACVARKVMEIEERDFYKEVDRVEDFRLSDSPRPQDLALPTLPESYRISEVEVILLGSPMDKIQLFRKQRQLGIGCRSLASEYNVHLRQWIDKNCG